MTSLAELIQTYKKGTLSRESFFAQIDRALVLDFANCARLRETLDQTQTQDPLPDAIYAELIRHIERLTHAHQRLSDETRVQAGPAPAATASMPDGGAQHEQSHTKGIGDTLNGRFVLEACLGVGGMGTVYKALDLRKLEAADRMPYIAIKVLNVQFRGQPTSLIALQREARKAQTLAHRNIVTVYDFDRDGPIVYITMEYLSGGPLSALLREPGFAGMPYDKALPIIAGMGRALAYAHERGFVHCDFKPANVFLTDSGEVKVIDFGIARALTRPDEEADLTVFDPATLGGITPAYASPEMFEHRQPDPSDDVYAMACVTYELLTGRHPFNRMSSIEARAARKQPERPSGLNRRQWKALSEALSLDRATRTANLERFMDGMGALMKAPPAPAKAASTSAGRAAKSAPVPETSKALETTQRTRSARVGVAMNRTLVKSGSLTIGALVAVAALWYGYRAGTAGGPGSPVGSHTRDSTNAPSSLNPSGAIAGAEPRAASAGAAATPASRAPLSLAAVSPVLAEQPCSALSAAVVGSTLRLSGYVEQGGGVSRLRDALAPVVGADAVSLDVQPVSSVNCDAVSALAPYWAATHRTGSVAAGASIQPKAPNGNLVEGSPLVVNVTTPGYDSYVSVDYYALDGNVVHLVPSHRAKDNQAPPHYAATIGDAGEWIIGKPFGIEMIVLVVTPEPLFDALRPDVEPHADYLAALKERLQRIAAKDGAGRVGVDIAQITTRAAQR
ncbi:protein kinase domain-containing protein [Trinickia sp.]|uniref:serine/threonine protein kinase n=1 Tax=Trinickia sp. TaxID=2571163 RepID=UPI003F7D14EB